MDCSKTLLSISLLVFFRQNNYPRMVRRWQGPIWLHVRKQETDPPQLSIISLLSISNSLLVLFDERTIENVNQHRNLKESFKRKSGNEKRMKRISDSHAVDPEERWMEARWGERGKKWFLGKLQQFFPTKFLANKLETRGNTRKQVVSVEYFWVKYSLSNCGGEDVTWVIGFPLLFSLSYITSHYF